MPARTKAASRKSKPPNIVIDPEFAAWLPAAIADEDRELEQSLRQDGCRQPLVLWRHQGADVLLDGHRRYRFCRQLGIPFAVEYLLQLKTRREALLWMIRNQLQRRNLSPKQVSALRGKEWNLVHARPGRPNKSGTACPIIRKDEFAAERGVSPRTITNDAEFAAALDVIEEVCGPAAMHRALRSGAYRHDIIVMADQPPAVQRQLDQLHQTSGTQTFRKAVERLHKAQSPIDYHAKLNRLISHMQKEAQEFPRRWWPNLADAFAAQAELVVSWQDQPREDGDGG